MRRLLFGSVVLMVLASGSAMAADLSVPPTPVAPAPYRPLVVPVFDWTGPYVGGYALFNWTHTTSTTTDLPTGAVTAATEDRSRVHGGGHVGYDYMMPSRWVLGIVADATEGEITNTTTSNAAGTVVEFHSERSNVSGTVRGRVGYAFDTFLLYGTGGWAWATGSQSRAQLAGTVNGAVPGTLEVVNTTHFGWTGGAGVSYAFWRNFDAFAEYRYTRFDSNTITFPLAGRSTTSTTSANAVLTGVDYRFTWPSFNRY